MGRTAIVPETIDGDHISPSAPGAQPKPLVSPQHPVEPGTDRRVGVSRGCCGITFGPDEERVVNQRGSSTNIVNSSGVESTGSSGRAKERRKDGSMSFWCQSARSRLSRDTQFVMAGLTFGCDQVEPADWCEKCRGYGRRKFKIRYAYYLTRFFR